MQGPPAVAGSGVTTRIVITGSECTGKTTLARGIAARLAAPWLREAARDFALERLREGRVLTAADVEPIARRTISAEDAALVGEPAALVLDTDLISTVVYARHYYGACPAWIEAAALERRGALYLCCAPDIPWEPDGVRDRPSTRDAIDELFRTTLGEFGATVANVTGTGRLRESVAFTAVESCRIEAVRP